MKWMNKLRSVPAMIACIFVIFVIFFVISRIIITTLSSFLLLSFVVLVVLIWSGIFGWLIGKYYPTEPKRTTKPKSIRELMDEIMTMINNES